MPHHVLVTHHPEEETKQIMTDVLSNTARISFLPEVSGSERNQVLAQADVVLGKSLSTHEIPPEDLQRMKNLGLVQLVFAGADTIPFEHIPEKVLVANNPGAFSQPIAEHVLAMTLALAKSLLENHALLSKGRFEQNKLNKGLQGQTCGIVGLGGNGRAVAKLLQRVGMRVLGINRSGTSDVDIDFLGTSKDLPFLLHNSDVLVLCVPLNRWTKHLITAEELSQMKPDAILINVARGEVIKQRDLYLHLANNPGFSVGIDTWWVEPGTHGFFAVEYPFFELPNLIGSPHNADDVQGVMTEASKRAAENIRRFFKEGEMLGMVDREDYRPA